MEPAAKILIVYGTLSLTYGFLLVDDERAQKWTASLIGFPTDIPQHLVESMGVGRERSSSHLLTKFRVTDQSAGPRFFDQDIPDLINSLCPGG